MQNDEMRELLSKGPTKDSRWIHKKGGIYRVVTTALNESTLDVVVVYTNEQYGVTWIRPLAEFMDGRFIRLDGGV